MSSRFDRFITTADREREMGDAIEALERHTATLSNLCRDRLFGMSISRARSASRMGAPNPALGGGHTWMS